MSGTLLALVQAHYSGMAQGNPDAAFAVCAHDIEWIESAGSPYAGVYRGATEILAGVMGRIASDFDPFALEELEFMDAGEAVIVLGWYRGTGSRTGTSFRSRFVHVWRGSSEELTRFEQIVDSTDQWKALTTAL